MIYKVISLCGSGNGQALLQSVEERGGHPAISLQIPENKAKQIVAAFDFIEKIANLENGSIDFITATNTKETLIRLRQSAQNVLK